jgi:3-oxoacyl-[acyl-carrier protein] reductase
MNIDLTGKTALVCGSTQGIGRATAIEMAESGASVILIARNEEKLKETVSILPKIEGRQHDYIIADFSFPDKLSETLQSYLSKNKQPIEILVNNTGGPPGGAVINAHIDEFRRAFNNHLICNHILTTALVAGMKKAGYGRIINIISTSVKIPLPGLGVSNTIRSAVANWAKSMANELGQFQITVNNVLPGATETERLKSIIKSKAEKTGNSEEVISENMKQAIPMKRFAQPGEVAAAIVFLASPAASYINGINIPVDGGRTGSL